MIPDRIGAMISESFPGGHMKGEGGEDGRKKQSSTKSDVWCSLFSWFNSVG